MLFNGFAFGAAPKATVAFLLLASQSRVMFQYRNAVTLVGMVALYAAILNSIMFFVFLSSSDGNEVSVGLSNGAYSPSMRILEWMVSAPILVSAVVLLLGLEKSTKRLVLRRLVVSSVLMTLLAYAAELVQNQTVKLSLTILAFLAFFVVLHTLLLRLNTVLREADSEVAMLFRRVRNMLIFSWLLYPVGYLIYYLEPSFLDSATTFTMVETIYNTGDSLSKVVLPLMLLHVARQLSAKLGVPEQA